MTDRAYVCLPVLPEGCEWAPGTDMFPDDLNVNDNKNSLVAWIELETNKALGIPTDQAVDTRRYESCKAESPQQAADYLAAQLFIGNWRTERSG